MAKKEENSKWGTFPRKWAKVLENLHQDDDFVEKAQQASTEELDKIIVNCNEVIAEMNKNMDADQELKEAKEKVKDVASQYTDGIKINNAKSMFCIYMKNSL